MTKSSSIGLTQLASRGLLLSISLATACATTRGKYEAVAVDGAGKATEVQGKPNGIQVSAEEVTALSSPNLGVVAITFSNPTEDFVRVSGITLDFGEPLNAQVSIPLGEEISSWAEAISARNRLRANNTALTLGVLTLGGAVLSNVAGHHRQALATGTAFTLAEIEVGRASAESAQIASLVPPEHLLGGPFSVPPQLFTKKWIVLKSDARANKCITRVFLTFESGNDPAQKLLVKFRERGSTFSEWQEKQCAPLPPNEFGK